jgi:hypothetical protein
VGVAVLSFFAVPYISVPLVGSLTGIQLANVLNAAHSAAQFSAETSQSSQPGFNPAWVLWLQVLVAAVITAIAGWQWARVGRSGASASRGASVAVLIVGASGLVLMILPLVVLQSSAEGQVAASALFSLLAIGFWLMVLAMVAVIVGAIVQLAQS